MEQRDVVAVRPVIAEPAREVGFPALGELGAEPLGPVRARSRAVFHGRRLRQAELLPERGEGAGEQIERGGAMAHEIEPVAGELGVPDVELGRSRGARPDAGEERVALGECPGIRPARGRSRRPERRDELVEVGAAPRGCALDELQAVRQEDGHQRPHLDVAEPVDGRAVDA